LGKPDKQQQGEVVNAEDKGTPEIIENIKPNSNQEVG